MPYYCVRSISLTAPLATYWVWAESADMARKLVALNVSGAISACDGRAFQCYEDETKKPPAGVIYSDIGDPITISFPG
jgi:hypothetical protein